MERKFKVNNTIYQRSKRYGVGKEIGGKVYVHKNYATRIVNQSDLEKAISLLPKEFKYNCIMVDRNKPYIIRFDEAPDFDTAREPVVGDYIEINIDEFLIREGHSNSIWHHKWMWVDDDYERFDVDEAYQWSIFYTQYIHHPSGSEGIWNKQLSDLPGENNSI